MDSTQVKNAIDRLHRGERVHVKVPGGAAFAISHKTFAGVHGYATHPKGQRPAGTQKGHRMMGKDELHDWLSSLEHDSSQHCEEGQFGERWKRNPGSKIQAPLSYKGHYVISHRENEHTVSYRPPGQHHHVGTYKTEEEAKKAADAHAASQHSETEQFVELGKIKQALEKHGYRMSHQYADGSSQQWVHDATNSVAHLYPNAKKYKYHHSSDSHGNSGFKSQSEFVNHLGKVHSSQHSEEVEQFGEPGKPFQAGKYHPSGTVVKFHGGEHEGRVVELGSVIPKRYNKEETVYRAKILGGKFASESARNIHATDSHLAKFAHYHSGDTQHAEDNHIHVWAVPNLAVGKNQGKHRLVSKTTGYDITDRHYDTEDDARKHVEELNKRPNMMRKYKFHSYSQHTEASEEIEEKLQTSTMIHPSMATFGSAILMKKLKPSTTQHSEQFGEVVAGRSGFLVHGKGLIKRRSFSNRLHQILQKHGGSIHNGSGGFTLPKKAVEAFNQSAEGAGYQRGHHYSLNG